MRMHKEGRISIIVTTVLALILIYFAYQLESVILQRIVYLIAVIPLAFTLYFFRDPGRSFNAQPDFIFAPADGKVVAIEKVFVDEFLEEERIQVSIFMSPFNVHINWMPLSGIVKYFKYHPGKFLVAWHPKSSTLNERSTLVVADDKGRSILVRQVAGAMARRIVHYYNEGDKVVQGSELGFIKLGSRVDLFLPLDVKIKVSLEEPVEGNRSIIAEW